MSIELLENVSLAELTTLKIGGNARFFLSAKSDAEIIEALNFAEQNDLPIFILGGGSNVVIADEGFDGLVLQIATKGIFVEESNDKVLITAQAGEDWDSFVNFCVEKNLQGVECLSGIPGLVGGTPIQNVGAYGQEVSETIFSVKCYDRRNRETIELSNQDCQFAYRTSLFNSTEKNRYVVLSVTYEMNPSGEPKIVYQDLRNFFDSKTPTLQKTRDAVLKIRAEKSMVINDNDPNSRSAGSFFKNPIVAKEKFAEIEERAKAEMKIEKIPFFEVDAESVKIPAAWLIEQSGFPKGFEFGRVGLSAKHTLAIINRGGAKAIDVINLKNLIQSKVRNCFSVELKPEPIFVGFLEK